MATDGQSIAPPLAWANLLHLSYNMWADRDTDAWGTMPPYIGAKPFLRFDEALWRDLVAAMAGSGMNMVVLDLGDGVIYDSHPEIAVTGAWSTDRLRTELAHLRAVGIEPIPKLNFSTAHDAWLGEYSRMVSTRRYYEVCADLIGEVAELFDTPRLFHLGMDEETAAHQSHFEYSVIRQHELWWHDLRFYVDCVEKAESRAWVWSDYVWHHPKPFYERMPRSVVQSNWYYEPSFEGARTSTEPEPYDYPRAFLAYLDLAEHGFDQIPTGSNYGNPLNFGRTVEFCRRNIPANQLLGFLQTPWFPTLEEKREHHLAAVAQVQAAREGRG